MIETISEKTKTKIFVLQWVKRVHVTIPIIHFTTKTDLKLMY